MDRSRHEGEEITERTYQVPLSAAGSLPQGHPDRERVVEGLAAAIYVEWNVRNLLVWENVRKPHVRHWREDCPSLRRTKHAKSMLVPREKVEEGNNCGMCIHLDYADKRRRGERRRARILALEPPSFAELPLPWRPPIALLEAGPQEGEG